MVAVGDIFAVVVVGQPAGDDALLAGENQLVVAAGLGPFEQLGLFLGEVVVLDARVGRKQRPLFDVASRAEGVLPEIVPGPGVGLYSDNGAGSRH